MPILPQIPDQIQHDYRCRIGRFIRQLLQRPAAWGAELKRRAEEIQSGRVTGEPAEKLLREMRAKYS